MFFFLVLADNNVNVLLHRSTTHAPSTSASQSTCTTLTSTTTNVEIRRPAATSPGTKLYRLGLRLEGEWRSIPWDRLRSIKWKNERAAPGCAYKPTEVSQDKQIS